MHVYVAHAQEVFEMSCIWDMHVIMRSTHFVDRIYTLKCQEYVRICVKN